MQPLGFAFVTIRKHIFNLPSLPTTSVDSASVTGGRVKMKHAPVAPARAG
jgi:hypothetical protein